MGTPSVLHILPNPDREGRFWARQLLSGPNDQTAFLVRATQYSPVIMWLLRAWVEASGKTSSYWAGSLWDIPVVRKYLKELKQQNQVEVLQALEARQQIPLDLFDIQTFEQRDAEALRCFRELLEPSKEVMSLDSWRELCDVCRTTRIEVGTLPWSVPVLSESDQAPTEIETVWIPQAQCSSNVGWPAWLENISSVCATASKKNDRGMILSPDYALAKRSQWQIREGDEEGLGADNEPESPQHHFQLKGEPLKRWQDQLQSHIFSSTELETYLRSPYAYYCERVLKLNGVEEEGWDLEAAELGLLAHDVLEDFYSQNEGLFEDHKFDIKASFAQLDGLLADAVKALQQERPGLENMLVQRQQQRVQRALHAVVLKDSEDISSQQSPLYPKYFEWSFGKGNVPPLELPGDIRLRGTVDRIDVDPVKKTFLIIDYKTGSRVITGADIERGASLQLPLYIEAVRQILLPDYTPIGAIFFSLADLSKKNGMLRLDYASDYFELSLRSSSLMTPEKWQDVQTNALACTQETVEAIRQGMFPRCEEICVGYCPYQDMCGCGVAL